MSWVPKPWSVGALGALVKGLAAISLASGACAIIPASLTFARAPGEKKSCESDPEERSVTLYSRYLYKEAHGSCMCLEAYVLSGIVSAFSRLC